MSRIFDYSANKSVIRPVKNRKPPRKGRSEPRCQYGVAREKFTLLPRNNRGGAAASTKCVGGAPGTIYDGSDQVQGTGPAHHRPLDKMRKVNDLLIFCGFGPI